MMLPQKMHTTLVVGGSCVWNTGGINLTYLELCHLLNSLMTFFFVFGILYFVVVIVIYDACCNVLKSASSLEKKNDESDYYFCLSLLCSDGLYWIIILVTFNVVKALHYHSLTLLAFVIVLVLAMIGLAFLAHHYNNNNIDYDNKCRNVLTHSERVSSFIPGFVFATGLDIIVMLIALLRVL